ncbi:MAG: BrxE family protein [Chloroflexales bacterium]
MTTVPVTIDSERLFQLRLVIARLGEMDNAGWWNTRGALGPTGAFVYRRGFPVTAAFAQARVVFAVAAARCQEVFTAPNCVTLWQMPAEVEDLFEDMWQQWLDAPDRWQSLFTTVAALRGADAAGALLQLDLITERDAVAARQVKPSPEARSVKLDEVAAIDTPLLTLLAAGFAQATPGRLVVPYVQVTG